MNENIIEIYPYQILDINDLKEEEWRDIEGYSNYQVSNYGRVKSLNYNKTNKPKILKQEITKKGYLRVTLYKEGKVKRFSVHRLVTLAFIDNSNNLSEVNHKDEIKVNNVVSNLEWCDRRYNINFGTRNTKVSFALQGMKLSQETKDKIGKAKSIQIVQCDLNGNIVNIWKSAHEAERENNFHNANIIQCCKKKYHKLGNNVYKGYKWYYYKELFQSLQLAA